MSATAPQFVRLAERARERVAFTLDGRPAEALAGDTLMTAILLNGARVRVSEFGDGPRAGLCLMGACQECWVRVEGQGRLRACTSYVAPGMRVETGATDAASHG